MRYAVFDIETDGLLNEVTKIHCLSYKIFEDKKLISSNTLTDYKDIAGFVTNQKILVGHRIIQYDIPVLEKILDIKITAKLIDTLSISWYLYPISKFKHGLEAWGKRLGFEKPKVENWKDDSIEVYINRCESDVEINTRLFHHQMDYTMSIYDNNLNNVLRLFGYLAHKMDCLKDQEEAGITLDVRLVEKAKYDLEFEIEEKMSNLAKHMPKVLHKKAPKVMYKKDGTLSTHGLKWKHTLKNLGLDENADAIYVNGNPGSPSQLKDWLFSLGWKPITFTVSKNTGEKLPQISLPYGAGLCPSVKELFEEYPYLKDLEGLYKAKHRYGILKSFLESKDSSNKVYSTAHGFTNTLRLQHSKPIVNLPSVDKYYGKEIRGALTVPDDSYIMCGSDISGLEDNTKQHYIYFYDPEYVKEMRVPGFDPHIDIGLLAGLLTQEEVDFYKNFNPKTATKEEKQEYKRIKKIRSTAKTVNFSATYGAGPKKIASVLKSDLGFAEKLHSTYWKRNAAIKKVADSAKIKTVVVKNYIEGIKAKVLKQKWLYNPVSGFWMYLKADKDRFSTLNQSSGVYVFDSWLRKVREALKPLKVKVIMQYHDELLLVCKKEQKEKVDKILKDTMEQTNKEIKLNVDIKISTSWGKNYAECH